MTADAILIASADDAEEWAARIRAAAPDRDVRLWPDAGDKAAIGYVLAWKPPAGVFAGLTHLRAIFSLGAGVDHLIFRDDLPDVPIVRAVDDDLSRRMAEWVTLQVLMHHRRQRAYDAAQRARRWAPLPQPAARDVRVGIMGLGALGRRAAPILRDLGFQVAGWSRRPRDIPGVRSFHGDGQRDAFLARTDILVVLLPLTAETRGILALPLFGKLAQGGALGRPVLINAGRGGLQVEADIIAALDAGILGGASLDVFQQEPLDPESPLWRRDDVIITPHAAAWSDPAAMAPAMIDAIRRFEAGEPLAHAIDRAAGY